MFDNVITDLYINTMYADLNVYASWRASLINFALIVLVACIVVETIKKVFNPKVMSWFKPKQATGLGFVVLVICCLISHGFGEMGIDKAKRKAFQEDPTDARLQEFVRMVDEAIRNQKPEWRK